MKKMNWTEVEESTPADWLPRGGYVIEITDVEDREEWECLILTFDIAEGEQAHKFKDVPLDRDWTHQLRQSYNDNAKGFFKGFLTALEKSNPGFSVAEWQKESDESKLIGLKVGAVINYYHGVKEDGTPKQTYNFARAYPVDKIRSGKYKVPDDPWSKDARELEEETDDASEESTGAQGNLYSDVPF